MRLERILIVAVIGAAFAAPEALAQNEDESPIARRLSSAVEEPPTFGRLLLREGAFLPDATGQMRQLASGAWAFVFEPGPSGRALPPMLLLPSMNLAAMEQMAESRAEELWFRVSGQVFVYHDRNYLLVTTQEPVTAEEQSSIDAANAADDEASEAAAELPEELAGGRDEPSVEELIQALETATPVRREASVAGGGGGAPSEAGLQREGSIRTLRRGRVVPGPGRQWDFVTDNDAETSADLDPPMTLMPSLNLERIEDLALERGDSLAFRISGRVFVYEGRNYLMPTMFVVDFDRTGNVVLGQ
ncbi:MAG: hypothetical protein VYC34_10835 [Planctomycetota bacterium]|nr:hypothetical protein [Planctomycetota bacterium]